MNLENLQEAISFFIMGFLELSVLFLAISFLVEILNVYMNPTKVQRLLSSNKSGYLIASGLGAITPFCSCSSIPLTMGLIKAKAGFGPIMTFLFTSPLLNPIVVVVFYVAFGLEITLAYSLIALSVSLLAGFILDSLGFEKYIKKQEEKKPTFSMKSENNTSCCTPKTQTFTVKQDSCCEVKIEEKTLSFMETMKEKVLNKQIVLKTYKQFLSFVPYIAIGIGIGSLVHGFVPEDLITKYAGNDNILAVPFSAIIGVPLYIRADMMVGLAPELINKGVNMGSILALTIAGAGASLPEMIMLKKIFRLPIMIFFVLTVFSMAIACGYLVNLYFA